MKNIYVICEKGRDNPVHIQWLKHCKKRKKNTWEIDQEEMK